MTTHTLTRYNGTRVQWLVLLLLLVPCAIQAQSAFDVISRNRNLSATNYCIYPDSADMTQTPAPAGKKPFYISHYGRHGSRYIARRKGYDIPLRILSKADSLGKLTETGRLMLQELREILDDSEGRWGDLTGRGKRQQRGIARRMMERYPEVFQGTAHVDAKSTTANRCILSMGAACQQLTALNPQLQISMKASQSDMWYMNYQDKYLHSLTRDSIAMATYKQFSHPRMRNPRLMHLIFNDSLYLQQEVDNEWLSYYLMKTALIQQNTRMGDKSQMIDYFTYEDIHLFWQRENAYWYLSHGPSPLLGGKMPYSQRHLLRKMIEEADSCILHKRPGVQLRFGHETVVLPLTCLMGINGFDQQVTDLEQLEGSGWWACLVVPMASNIQWVFYRSIPADKDILVKVLLNEQEARLPLPGDMAPYYRWSDFRRYYLKKIADYETQQHTSASALP